MERYQASWHMTLNPDAAPRESVVALLARLPHATVFNSPEWCEAAAAALAPGRDLHVLAVTRNGALAAWLPLVAARERVHGIRVATLRLLGYPFNDRVAVPMLPGDTELAAVVMRSLPACPWPWDLLLLSELHDMTERRTLDAAATHAREWRCCSRSPVLRLGQSSEHQLKAGYGRTLVTRVARSRRKLEALGAVRFERIVPPPDQVASLVGVCKTIEDASWKGERRLGIFSSSASARFFADVGMRFAARGWLDIGLLHVEGKAVSYRYGFRYRDVFLDYNLAYLPEFAACGPGRILLDEMIVSSLRQGLAAVDASRSSVQEPHLLNEWTDEHIDHHELWLFRQTWRGRLVEWVRRHLRPAWHRLRALCQSRPRR